MYKIEVANFLCKEPGSKYIQLSGHTICHNYSALPLELKSSQIVHKPKSAAEFQ